MAEATLESILFLSDAIHSSVSDYCVEVTWLTLALPLVLILTLIGARFLLWQWRVGCYEQRYVLVTGCDSGFGFELVKDLDSLGYQVFAGCLTSEGVEQVSKATSRHVRPISLDVTDNDSIQRVLEYIRSELPPKSGLWGVVNNAGIMPTMASLELTPRDCFERTLAVNFLGTVEVTRACLPLVRKSRGRIINMSSVTGRVGFTAPDYTASKFAVEGFSQCLRREVCRDGISVSTIVPGGFRTRLCNVDEHLAFAKKVFDSLKPEVQDHYGKDYITSRKNFFDVFRQYIDWDSHSLDKVVDAYEHALSAQFPRTCYVVGLDAQLFFQPLWCLPDCIADLVLTAWPVCRFLK